MEAELLVLEKEAASTGESKSQHRPLVRLGLPRPSAGRHTARSAACSRMGAPRRCSCAEVGGGTNFSHDYGRGGFGRPGEPGQAWRGYPVRGYEAFGPHYHGARPGIVAGTPAGLAAIGMQRTP